MHDLKDHGVHADSSHDAERSPLPGALGAAAGRIAAAIDDGGPIDRLAARVAAVMDDAIRSGELDALFDGKTASFKAYRDPDRGFVIDASIHPPGYAGRAHDHGESWAVYCNVRGTTGYRLYDRGDDAAPGVATLELREHFPGASPHVAVVAPGQVHENFNDGDAPAWNLVVRPRPNAEVWRRVYDTATGRYHPMRRPTRAAV